MNQRMIFEALLTVLSNGVLIFTTLILNFALFAWAVYEPDYLRFATAGLFSITVFIPVLKIKSGQTRNIVSEEREAA